MAYNLYKKSVSQCVLTLVINFGGRKPEGGQARKKTKKRPVLKCWTPSGFLHNIIDKLYLVGKRPFKREALLCFALLLCMVT